MFAGYNHRLHNNTLFVGYNHKKTTLSQCLLDIIIEKQNHTLFAGYNHRKHNHTFVY